MKRYEVVSGVALTCILSMAPSLGALACQQDGELLYNLLDTVEVNDAVYEPQPIPIEKEIEIIAPEQIIGNQPPAVVIEQVEIPKQKQIKDELILGDIEYVATVIEHESRGEPYKGKVAVGCTVWNKAEHDNMSVYDVIFTSGQYSCAKDDGTFVHAGWSVSEESYKAAIESYTERPYPDYFYFRTEHYHKFGTPKEQIGKPYFSGR